MSTNKGFTCAGSTVYETESGILGRHVATFSYVEDAARYVDAEASLAAAQARIAELQAQLTQAKEQGHAMQDAAKAQRDEEYEKRKAEMKRAEKAEAALADRIEHCQKYHSGSAIAKILTDQHGQAFAVYLSDGQKIGIEREGGAAWLRIEPTPVVREAGE